MSLGRAGSEGPDVMLVFGDPLDGGRLLDCLSRHPYSIATAHSAEDGLDLLHRRGRHKKNRWSAGPGILVLSMKDEDGDPREVLRRLRSHSSMAHVPVLFAAPTQTIADCGDFISRVERLLRGVRQPPLR